MKTPKLYQYEVCSTCKKAVKFLEAKKVRFENIPIKETPPSAAELKKMLAYLIREGGQLRKLFNTSGQMYREMGLKDKLAKMSEGEAVALLSKHGMLVKRPFLLTEKGGAVGFREAEWKKLL